MSFYVIKWTNKGNPCSYFIQLYDLFNAIFVNKLQITGLKEEKKSKAKSGLKVVVGEIMEKLKKYEESYGQHKQTKAENEQKFEAYKKEMQDLDARLTALGEIVEAFDDICKYFYKRSIGDFLLF